MYCAKGADFMAFSIRLTEEEKLLAESYARLHSLSLAEAFKRALFGQIEDEYDITIASEAYNDYIKSGKKSRPISELWKELDL
jgi:topoisomerase IA-like protein